MKKKNIYIGYLAIVFALSYLWQFVIFRTGGVQSPLFSFLMWIPGSIAIVFILTKKESLRKVGWDLKKWPYICFINGGITLGHIRW